MESPLKRRKGNEPVQNNEMNDTLKFRKRKHETYECVIVLFMVGNGQECSIDEDNIKLCMNWHTDGKCHYGCFYKSTHGRLSPSTYKKVLSYTSKARNSFRKKNKQEDQDV